MKIYIVGEYREQFPSKIDGHVFNPHPSYSSIIDVLNACIQKGYECTHFGGVKELVHAVEKQQKFEEESLFLNMSDGINQSYCRLQAPILLEMLDVKYTGSTPFVVGLINNKYYTKLALKKFIINDIKFPNDLCIMKNDLLSIEQARRIGYPIIVKPNNDGFSIGIENNSITYDYAETINQISLLKKEYEEIIIENYIAGIDASVFLIGNNSNIVVNEIIVYKTYGTFFQEKNVRGIYEKVNKLSEKIPATKYFSSDTIKKLKDISVNIFNSLNIKDIARIDYRINKNNEIYFLEVNTNPVLASNSDVKIVCQNLNISYSDLINIYIKTALSRYS